MKSTSDSLKEVKELLEAGWNIRWEGRTGSEYPPNQRLVEFEKNLDDEPYTRVRQLHLLQKDYVEVEKLRERAQDSEDEESDEGDEADEDEGQESSENEEDADESEGDEDEE